MSDKCGCNADGVCNLLYFAVEGFINATDAFIGTAKFLDLIADKTHRDPSFESHFGNTAINCAKFSTMMLEQVQVLNGVIQDLTDNCLNGRSLSGEPCKFAAKSMEWVTSEDTQTRFNAASEKLEQYKTEVKRRLRDYLGAGGVDDAMRDMFDAMMQGAQVSDNDKN